MRKHPLIAFYLLALGLAWLGWLPAIAASRGATFFAHPVFQVLLLLPGVGPTLAAMLVVRVTDSKKAVRRWFAGIWRWKVGWGWTAVAVFLPVAAGLLNQTITRTFGIKAQSAEAVSPGTFIGFLLISLLSNPWEEAGWRGFALPRLQVRHTALVTSLIVGALWGLWHLPLFFWPDNPMNSYPFGIWFVSTVASAIVYTWLYNSSGGSVFATSLYHIAKNTINPWLTGTSIGGACIVEVIMAGVLLAVFGPTHLARRERPVA